MDSLIAILLAALAAGQFALLIHLSRRLLMAKDRLADAERDFDDLVTTYRAAGDKHRDMRDRAIAAAGSDTNRASVRRMLEILKG